MAGETDAKEIEIKAKVGGSDIHPTIVVLLESINSVAQGSITYIHKSSDAKSSATDITSADIFNAMGERQTKSFTDTPDTTSAEINLRITRKAPSNLKVPPQLLHMHFLPVVLIYLSWYNLTMPY